MTASRILMMAVTLLLASVVGALAYDPTFAWDAPTNYCDGTPIADVIGFGYRVYTGVVSSNYTVVRDAGTNCLLKLTNLPVGKTNYFAVTAYLTAEPSIESDFSDELDWFHWSTNSVTNLGLSIALKRATVGWSAATGASGVTAYLVALGKQSGVYCLTNSYSAAKRTATIPWTNGAPLYCVVGYMIGTNRSPWYTCAEWSVKMGDIPARPEKLRW